MAPMTTDRQAPWPTAKTESGIVGSVVVSRTDADGSQD
jgi:hypothetical protein